MPASAARDRDATVDNQLGMIFGALQGQGFGVGDTVDESLVRGNAIMLMELQTFAFDDAHASGLQTALGANPMPAACSDPQDLTTCGHHLETRATYDVVPDSTSPVGVASIVDGQLLVPIGTLPIAIGLDPAAPLRLDLVAAQIRLTEMSADHATAIIAGAITPEDLDAVVIPEIARNLDRILRMDCTLTGPPAPCGCPAGSRGKLLQDLFDDDDDCEITRAEVADSSLIASLFAPDLRMGGRDMLSFGIGAELVPAAFTR